MKIKKSRKNSKNQLIWPITILFVAIILSFSFSLISELVLNVTHIVIAIIVIFVFISISIVSDMLGLAVASANAEHFTAMASKKVKGAKQGLALIKNADKVSSILNDVIGDVCGILSGAAGASIVAKIIIDNPNNFLAILIPSLISALIAGITIFGKSIVKRYAIIHANKLTLNLAKFITIFTRIG